MSNHGDAVVLYDRPVLRCGECRRPVGSLRWDAAGWPHLDLRRPRCPTCGRRPTFDPSQLEADTVARYSA